MLGERIIAAAGFPAYLLTALGFAAVSVALTTLVPPRPPVLRAADAVPHMSFRALLRAMAHPGLPIVMVVTVVLGVAINAAFFFVAPFTRDVGLARSGSFFVAYSATSVVIRLFGRRVLDVLGPHLISYPAFAIFGFGLAALALLPAPGILVLSGIACGAGHGTLFPVLNALAISRAPARLQGTVVSLHTAALDFGAVVGTPLCGLLAQLAGWRSDVRDHGRRVPGRRDPDGDRPGTDAADGGRDGVSPMRLAAGLSDRGPRPASLDRPPRSARGSRRSLAPPEARHHRRLHTPRVESAVVDPVAGEEQIRVSGSVGREAVADASAVERT